MSDIENKTENSGETKTSEAAPYMKKNNQKKGQPESPQNNIVIPLVLLLVSAFVIGATFYQDEYSDTVADAAPVTEIQTEASSPDISADDDNSVAQDSEVNATTEDNITAETATAEVHTVASNTAAPADNAVKAIAVTDQDSTVQQPNKRIADIDTGATNNRTRTAATYTPDQALPYADKPIKHQSYEQARKAAITRSQEQAKKHHEMMQQRRQAYETEIQARRQQYEAMMKVQQEKRAKIAEMQKAVFQRIQQDRLANNQRIQEMHEEIHRMMRDSQPLYRNNSAPQILHPAAEQIQTM